MNVRGLSEAHLTRFVDQTAVKFADIQKPAFYMLFRRFGWPLCRQAAAEVNELRAWFDEREVALIGVGFEAEQERQQKFVDSGAWHGPSLYADPEDHLYSFLETKTGSLWQMLSFSMLNAIRKAVSAFSQDGANTSQGTKMGGAFLVDRDGNVVYKYVQERFGEHAAIDDIKAAVESLQENQL